MRGCDPRRGDEGILAIEPHSVDADPERQHVALTPSSPTSGGRGLAHLDQSVGLPLLCRRKTLGQSGLRNSGDVKPSLTDRCFGLALSGSQDLEFWGEFPKGCGSEYTGSVALVYRMDIPS